MLEFTTVRCKGSLVELPTHLRQDSLLCRLGFVLSRAAQHLVVNDQLYINMLLRLHQWEPEVTAVHLHNVVLCSLCIVQAMTSWKNAWKEEHDCM